MKNARNYFKHIFKKLSAYATNKTRAIIEKKTINKREAVKKFEIISFSPDNKRKKNLLWVKKRLYRKLAGSPKIALDASLQ